METTKRFPPSAAESDSVSSFRMIDVGGKTATRRRAVARGTIRLTQDAFLAIREKKNPKGDVLALAEVAGIQAVKRVPDTIPLCHSLPIEYARLRFAYSEARLEVTVFCEVGTTAKTGVEMEALAGVNGALLSIYDLSKAVNPVLSISDIRLDIKEGGKSGRWTHPDFQETDLEKTTPLQAWKSNLKETTSSVLVVSDRCARGETQDSSGVRLETYLRAQGSRFLKKAVVPDEIERIRYEVLQLCQELHSQILFVTGGTGMAPRDVTPEALESLWTKRIPGIGELLRSSGSLYTPMSWISRSEAGLVGETLVVLLPGSESAVEQSLISLDPILSHILHVTRGGSHHHGNI
jgi:cyclic pyranopterin monophosphate synthase